MKVKSVVSVLLLLFVAASLVYAVIGRTRSRPDAAPAAHPPGAVQTAPPTSNTETAVSPTGKEEKVHKVIAYYFHGNTRCRTCLAIEEYARETVEEAFPDELKSGTLEWRAVNIDEPENEHFAREYELTTSSLVLVNTTNGQQTAWRNLSEVWALVGDKSAFQVYVQAETLAYLENGL